MVFVAISISITTQRASKRVSVELETLSRQAVTISKDIGFKLIYIHVKMKSGDQRTEREREKNGKPLEQIRSHCVVLFTFDLFMH